jgi:glutathione S-transferase
MSCLSLGELEDFNTFIDNGALSYAESYSAVTYIKDAHGDEAFRELLKGIAMGMSFEKALQATTGMGRDEFEEGWRRYLEEMLKPEGQAELPLKTMMKARAETASEEASATAAPALNANSDDLPSPWLLGASFASLLFAALLIRTLKALIGRATRPSL